MLPVSDVCAHIMEYAYYLRQALHLFDLLAFGQKELVSL